MGNHIGLCKLPGKGSRAACVCGSAEQFGLWPGPWLEGPPAAGQAVTSARREEEQRHLGKRSPEGRAASHRHIPFQKTLLCGVFSSRPEENGSIGKEIKEGGARVRKISLRTRPGQAWEGHPALQVPGRSLCGADGVSGRTPRSRNAGVSVWALKSGPSAWRQAARRIPPCRPAVVI